MPSPLGHTFSVSASQELTKSNVWDVVTVNHILVMSQEEFEEFQELLLPPPIDPNEDTAEKEESNSPSVQRPVLQVVDGKIIVQSSSLLSTAPAVQREVGTASAKATATASQWLKKDVLLLYLGLRLFGENFDVLSSFIDRYPDTTTFSRKQVLNKYKAEMKLKQNFIDYAVTNPLIPPPHIQKEFDLEL